jgi:hypothetical protein
MYDLKYDTTSCINATTTPLGGYNGHFLGSCGIGLVVTMLCDGILVIKCTFTST